MKLTLIEAFRALFYAPFYATEALGAYKAEGLDVTMITPESSAHTIRMLAEGAGQVSWGGPMRLMLAKHQNPASDAVGFCEVVGRDPFFLIGRTPNPQFKLADLLGPRVAVVSEVPTPWVTLRRDLELAGIDPARVARTPERTMGENIAALRAGEVDVIQLFQPDVQTLLAEGVGHLWYRAAERGLACYTTFNTTRAFIRSHPEAVLAMTRAMYRTQKWVAAHTGRDLAEVVASYLPDVPRATLVACCDEYKSSGVWSTSPVVQRAGLEWKRDAMQASGMIGIAHPYETYIDPQFAERAVADDPPSI
jgi:NitT/TauT family transport system substrate-binding protein